MPAFNGFADTIKEGVTVPEVFFTRALLLMTSVDEVWVCAQFFRLLKGDADGFLTAEEILNQETETAPCLSAARITAALAQAREHKILVGFTYQGEDLYFLNTPRARSIQRANEKGVWRPGMWDRASTKTERPNIFTLYEQNIGPLTPILAQTLEDAESTYSAEWVEEAIDLAVKKNVRNWKYVEAILRSWKEKGRNEKDRRNTEENPRSYIEGELADFIKH